MGEQFKSKVSFIMTAIGAAVGLGNIFRFPSLAMKYGVIYIIIYIPALMIMGLPLLMNELALGRHYRGSAVSSMKKVNHRFGFIGWLGVGNSFLIMTYYCLLFSFVFLATVFSFKIAGAKVSSASSIFANYIGGGIDAIPLLFLIASWAAVMLCFGKAERLGFISTASVIFASVTLALLALFRALNHPDALAVFLRLDLSPLFSGRFWADLLGQVFFSLSVMVGVMISFGSFLSGKESIASCSIIIALFDLFISLCATVIYATIVGAEQVDSMLTCFSVYPQAFREISESGAVSAIVAFLFYLSLGLLCLDSVFSYLKSVSGALSETAGLSEEKVALGLSVAAFVVGVFMLGNSRLIDAVDGFTARYSLVLTGIAELLVFGFALKPRTLLEEINKGGIFKYPATLFSVSVKFLSPLVLLFLILSELFF